MGSLVHTEEGIWTVNMSCKYLKKQSFLLLFVWLLQDNLQRITCASHHQTYYYILWTLYFIGLCGNNLIIYLRYCLSVLLLLLLVDGGGGGECGGGKKKCAICASAIKLSLHILFVFLRLLIAFAIYHSACHVLLCVCE